MPVDRFGDPLPEGAVSRLGSARFPQIAPFTAVVFSPDGKRCAAANCDGLLRIWETISGTELSQFGILDGVISALAWSPDGKVIVTGGMDGKIGFFDPDSGQLIHQLEGHSGGVIALAFSVDGETLISGGNDKVIRLWDRNSYEALGQFDDDYGEFEVLAFSSDCSTLALGSWDSTIRLFDLAEGKELWRFIGPRVGVKALAFSPDGRTLATASIDGSVGIWELTTGKLRRSFPKHLEGAFSVTFSRNGRMLASSGKDTTILIWSVYTRDARQTIVPLDRNTFASLWKELAHPDAEKAFTAMCQLATSPIQATPLVKEHVLRLTPPVEDIHRWIGELQHPQLAIREQATRELEQLGFLVEPYLIQAQEKMTSLEGKRRMDQLLAKLHERVPAPVALHALRGIEVLEIAGIPEARQALAAVARSKPESRLTAEANAAVQRMQ
ncbi:MAG: hypothetical protein KatS3mg105_1189 [Gemmatales bacterium]|nr:MAG: hypothetical protein KatS3mg105_1189 [Gemmatales bacterium]